MSAHWRLEKAADFIKAHPEKNDCLSIDVNESIQKGSKVKLIFCSNDTQDALQRELLWVEILLVQDGKLLGQLEDDPGHIASLSRGELIEFEEGHILESEYVDLFSPSIKV